MHNENFFHSLNSINYPKTNFYYVAKIITFISDKAINADCCIEVLCYILDVMGEQGICQSFHYHEVGTYYLLHTLRAYEVVQFSAYSVITTKSSIQKTYSQVVMI